MGKLYDAIDDGLRAFLEAQRLFFVATAPSGDAGHVNCSPKGIADTFRVLGTREVAYLDFVGSGVETIAHLRENGRIVLMFCAFDGPPRIVRLHGQGRAVEPHDAEFAEARACFPGSPLGVRAIVRVEVTRIADSCGYGVPRYEFVQEREQLAAWAERKGEAAIEDYKREKNAASIDGLPGLERR